MNRGPRDLGSASLICLAVGLALAALAIGISTGGGVVLAAHRARNAADSAALAGALTVARGSGAACAAAERLARENRGRLAACEVAGPIVTVTVEVRTRTGLVARARARAGPVQWVDAGPGTGPVEWGGAGPGAEPRAGPDAGARAGPDAGSCVGGVRSRAWGRMRSRASGRASGRMRSRAPGRASG